jgi:hypothetical protein
MTELREMLVPSVKVATNIDALFAWNAGEMAYSMDKDNYPEKLVRLNRSPENPQSVFGIRSNYWNRFRLFNQALPESARPDQPSRAVAQALQAFGKVVAGTWDKVTMTFWMDAKNQGVPEDEIDQGVLLDTSLVELMVALPGTYLNPDFTLLRFANQPLEENPMGQAVLSLHEAFRRTPTDIQTLREIALKGSVGGILMWQAYAHDLAARGFEVTLPKPGVPSGEITTW